MIYRITFLTFIVSFILFLRFSVPHQESQKNNIIRPQEVSVKQRPVEQEVIADGSETSVDPYAVVNRAITESLSFFDENNYNRSEDDYWNKLNKAHDVLKKIVDDKSFETDAKSKYFLGKVYFLLNEKKKAEKMFEQAISLKHDLSFAWNREHALYSEDYLLKMKE